MSEISMSENNNDQRKNDNQRGQGLIEYLILVALIAVATIGAVKVIGHSVSVNLSNVAKNLGAKPESAIPKAEISSAVWKKRDMRNFMQQGLERGSGRGFGQSNEE
ncbi:MAG: hypothetical protein C5B49_10675 [Bdellovibrio sp.]|nr:MAG: hypothetical protein C5B49_10675 [Bdellovibrio sp.]